ncbi:hypothetical protein [Albibacterium profundi]|uniref:PpiC domain-containing protein n=1 Tax=Albibacterium profundi TaxID=3134906 RepID=A0ABV5CE21_9SPHI
MGHHTQFIVGISGAVVIITLLLSACRDKGSPAPIARAYESYLYQSDLDGIINPDISEADSANMVNAYIEQWQRQKALLHHAQTNIKIDVKQIEKQIDEYRNSLIIYELEQALIKERLDTVVTEEEIANYYAENEDTFILKRPIFKVSFIELGSDAPELDRVKKWFASDELESRNLLRQYSQNYSTNYSLSDTSWYYLEEIAKKVPIKQIDENNYRNYGHIFQINENNKIYLIILRNSKFKDSRSPLDIERTNIRNLILNWRKIDLINREEKEILENARNNNKIEIYNQ